MNRIEKKLLPLAFFASLGACEEGRPLEGVCFSEGGRETVALELHSAINEAEQRYQRQRGRNRTVLVIGDLLQETQTCPVRTLREAVTVFDFAYRETGDQHFAHQRDIVRALVAIRRATEDRDLGPQPALEDTI